MPNWNLRTPSQVSNSADAFLTPVQRSLLDTALRHIGCTEDTSRQCHQTLLQVSTANTLQDPQEWLFLGGVGLLFAVLIVGGIVFWFTVHESRPMNFDEDHGKITKRSRYTEPKKISTATRLFPSYMVGAEAESGIFVKGTLTTRPENLLVEVCDDEDRAILRALVCETGPNPGILIEDAFNVPLAFIDTSSILQKNKLEKSSTTLRIHKLGEDEGLFGLIRQEEGNSHLVIRNAHGKLLLALQADTSGRSLNGVNDFARLVGTARRNNEQAAWKVLTLPGSDPGVMICGLLGIGKIGKLQPSTVCPVCDH